MEVILAHGQVRVDSGAGLVPTFDQYMDHTTSNAPERKGCHNRCRDKKKEKREKSCGINKQYRIFVVSI